MTVTVAPNLSDAKEKTVVAFAFSDQEPDLALFGNGVAQAVSSGFVRRKLYDITPLSDDGRRVLLVGLGEARDFTPLKLKRAAGAAVRYLRDRGIGEAEMLLPALDGVPAEQAAYLASSGAVLGAYDAGLYKSGEKAEPFNALTLVTGAEGAAESAERGRIAAEAANLARDLVNTPANDLPPAELARRAAEAGRAAGLDVEVFGRAEVEANKMAGILAVNAGSVNEPSFTVLKYMPNPGEAPVVLVGKGITFDSGGITIKPGADMHHMKGDMGGAAAVIGAVVAAANLKLPVNVVALVPSAENLPSGQAYRPSDVLTYANGKTVEVVNTDAEGRLILADALIYGEREFKPKAMVDLSTLTGACVIALGGDISGIFTDDDALAQSLLKASVESTEPAWRMPLYHPYRTKFDSGTADMQNAGDRWGGAITAALFLAEFVEDTPWAHIDIAGPAFDDTDKAWLARGGTGYGVEMLIEYLRK